MPKLLIVRDEVYEYPVNGDNNYGEEATNWAEAMTEIASEIASPGDIPSTEVVLRDNAASSTTSGNIVGLLFDTTFVQSMIITGHIERTLTDSSRQVEFFRTEGVYNGSEIVFSVEFAGDDTDFTFTESGGQFGYSFTDLTEDDGNGNQVSRIQELKIKFSAKAKVDNDALTGNN